jgi:dienelactone hydrolase
MIKKILDQRCLVIYPDTIDFSKAHPLIIMLHGVGETANSDDRDFWLTYLINSGPQQFIQAMQRTYKGTDFIAVMPQLYKYDQSDPAGNRNYTWPSRYVTNAYEWAQRTYKIDPQRIYLTGLSLGGGGVLNYITESSVNADKFAAAVACCPVGINDGYCNVTAAALPVACFHAMDDGTVGYKNSVVFVDAVNACRGTVIKAKGKYPEFGGHGVWDTLYNPNNDPFNNGVNVYDFFLMNTLSVAREMPDPDKKITVIEPGTGDTTAPPINQPPPIQVIEPAPTPIIPPPVATGLVAAVKDPIISLPAGTTNTLLDGSPSSGYDWITWDMISGPEKVWYEQPGKPNSSPNWNNPAWQVFNLKSGVYQFQLTCVKGSANKKTVVTVTVGAPVIKKIIHHYLVTPVYTDNTKGIETTVLPENITLK